MGREERAKRIAEAGRIEDEDMNAEMEERAMFLMDAGRDIELGKDLGNTNWSVDKKAPAQRQPREPKEKAGRPPREPKPPREPRPPKQRLDENGEPIVPKPRPKKLSKKEKKKMKKAAKKAKKKKKKKKKARKREKKKKKKKKKK